MELCIREAKPDDIEYIRNFQVAMAYESEKMRLDPDTCLRGVRAVFEDPNKGNYWIAELGNERAGCVLIQKEWSDWRAQTMLWVHSLYVRPEYRGKGLYRGIHSKLQERVKLDPSLGGIRLYVDKSNELAIQVYEKLGMTHEHYHLYEWIRQRT